MRHATSGRSAALVLASLLCLPLAAAAQQQPPPPPPAPPAAPAAPTAPASAAGATAEQAKAFLGDWTLSAESPQGPLSMALSIKDTAGKVAGQISSDMMPMTAITDITKAGENLVLRYSLDFNGTAVPVAITLTGGGDNVKVAFDFADGQFTMNGTGTKKKL